jgi:hypothetical protein
VVVATGSPAFAEPGFAPFQELPTPTGISAATASYTSLSCPTSSWCTALGGQIGDSSGLFVSTMVGSAWGIPQPIALPTSGEGVTAGIVCPSVGACVLAGTYRTTFGSQTLLAQESSGTWAAATYFSLPSNAGANQSLYLTVATPWCQSVGNCTVVGGYIAQGGGQYDLFSMNETSGNWGVATMLPGNEPSPLRGRPELACSSVGFCTVTAGISSWVESAGAWSPPTEFDQISGSTNFELLGLACPDATTCIGVGFEIQPGRYAQPQAATITQTSGTWGSIEALPTPQLSPLMLGTELWRISCQGDVCVAGGFGGNFDVRHPPYQEPIASTWSNGSWSSIDVEQFPLRSPYSSPGDDTASYFNDVSCSTTTSCVAVGEDAVYKPPIDAGSSLLFPFATTLTPVRSIVAPEPPLGAFASPHLNGVTVSWRPPTDDGGAPIADYRVVLSPGSASCVTTNSFCTFDGLVNGHQYAAILASNNGSQWSEHVLTNHVFAGEAPAKPTQLRTNVVGSDLIVSWWQTSPPVGESVLNFTVTVRDQSNAETRVTRRTSCTFHGLGHGVFHVSVTAVNRTGPSLVSLATAAIR